MNLSRILLGLRGAIPVTLKDRSTVATVKLLTQAFQNRGKKSPFLMGAIPCSGECVESAHLCSLIKETSSRLRPAVEAYRLNVEEI